MRCHFSEKRPTVSLTDLFSAKAGLNLFLMIIIFGSASGRLSATADFVSGRKVCLFFDDGWKNQFDEALPVLKEFGFKASFGVITDYMGLDRETFWSRMDVAESKSCKVM